MVGNSFSAEEVKRLFMGFLSFLGGKKAESINFSEIDRWLDKQVEGKRFDQRITRTKSVVKDLIADGHRYLEELEKAGLVNTNIPERAKQMMDGHRKAYISRIKRFLGDISIPDDFSQIGHYAARVSESLDSLSQETRKNYMIIREFLEVELTRVIKVVKGIEEELAKLQSEIDKEGVELIREAKIRLDQFKDDAMKKERLEQEKTRLESELEMLLKKKEKLDGRITELKSSKEYEQFRECLDENKQSEERINAIEQEMISIFSELNRPLKKYTHNTLHEKFVDRYIADPAGTLQEDDSLVISEILKKMGQELDTLELKDKQLDKTNEMLAKLSRDFLVERKSELSRLRSVCRDAATKINRSVAALNISENDSWLKSLDNKISQAEKGIAALNKQIEEINLDYLKQKVKEKVKEIATHVKIIDD
ncbi:MAG: hypothetical protein V1866_06655 [archaeon]